MRRSQSHDIAPDKFLLATEACTCPPAFGAWDKGEKYAHDIIGDLNAWAVGWTDWNLVLDMQGGPNHLQNWCDAPIMADVDKQIVRKLLCPYCRNAMIDRFSSLTAVSPEPVLVHGTDLKIRHP